MIWVYSLCLVLAADSAKPIDPAAFDRLAIDSLRDIHNRGAALYNESKDYTACFRLYEGALRTIQPLLAHRPMIQKRIVDGLAKLADDDSPRAKSFRLHELIESVRTDLRDTAVKQTETKPTDAKPFKPMPPAAGFGVPSPVPLTGVPPKP